MIGCFGIVSVSADRFAMAASRVPDVSECVRGRRISGQRVAAVVSLVLISSLEAQIPNHRLPSRQTGAGFANAMLFTEYERRPADHFDAPVDAGHERR